MSFRLVFIWKWRKASLIGIMTQTLLAAATSSIRSEKLRRCPDHFGLREINSPFKLKISPQTTCMHRCGHCPTISSPDKSLRRRWQPSQSISSRAASATWIYAQMGTQALQPVQLELAHSGSCRSKNSFRRGAGITLQNTSPGNSSTSRRLHLDYPHLLSVAQRRLPYSRHRCNIWY